MSLSYRHDMSMMDDQPSSCKVSMFWNWYTTDSCFISESWQVKTSGGFAGACVGSFFLVVFLQWLHRFNKELDLAMANRPRFKVYFKDGELVDGELGDTKTLEFEAPNTRNPFLIALSHSWLFRAGHSSPLEHLARCLLYVVEWGLAYFVMLLFMYYNGYVIISCLIGAFVGRFLFTYNSDLATATVEEEASCCL
ncbi:Copper transport protein CTR3 [Candida viswanathii]|uniref:Copper transport protein n=1 Tax=Candida viswanathii TaxID=5486 RepID=A0A367XTL0_9ASCO|nr:Copper transport protein CTR3 [Candida viswanathii]